MLKTSGSTESTTWLGKGRVKVGGNSRAGYDGRYKFDRSKIDDGEIDGYKDGDNEIGKKGHKMSKSKNLFKSKKTVEYSDFLILGVRLAFTKLRQAFIQAPILYHFDPKYYI